MSKNDEIDKYVNKQAPKLNKKKKKKHPILKAILILILVGIIAGIGLVIGFVQSVINGAGALSKSDFEISQLTTTVYDKNNQAYTQLYAEENRTYVSLSEMSPYLKEAFIAIEDERFEKHFGIDVKRTGVAVLKWLTTGNSDFGGSTITQQLIKKVTQDDDRSWQRKAREIVRAVQLEQWLSKDQIIELYMNLIYLGEGSYGVEQASHIYFNKSAKDLTIAECALMAGLAQAPEGRNPYTNPDGAKNRQKLVLGKMLELEKITQAQYDEAISQELKYEKGTLELASSNSYFIDAVVDQLIKDLQTEKGVTKVMAQKMVYSNGLKVYTTIDPEVQKALEDVYEDQNYFKLRNGTYDENVQSAMVIIDYKKGNVVGLIGGSGKKTTLRGLNRATQMTRAPGSTIKPLATYAPGIDTGVFTAATTYDDVPLTYYVPGSSTPWSPHNSYVSYRGLTSVRKGVEISSNIIAAKAFLDVTADVSYSYLEKFGITTLTKSDKVPGALALGGLTRGISPLEHAAAYGTIANGGIYVEPKLYTKVVGRNGEIILENVSNVREVLKESTAYIVTSMLSDVINGSEATGGSARLSKMHAAGKTGTSNESKDRWFAGFTPYYVASTWVGYDQQKTVSMSGNPAAKIWKAVMQKIHANLPDKEFTRPSTVVSATVCADSGLLMTDACKNDRRGDRSKTEWFDVNNVPTEECNIHKYVTVCPESFELPNPTCKATSGTINIVFLDRGYEEAPSKLPKDYDYEAPHTYCEYHYCAVDEDGNFIDNNSRYEDYANWIRGEIEDKYDEIKDKTHWWNR